LSYMIELYHFRASIWLEEHTLWLWCSKINYQDTDDHDNACKYNKCNNSDSKIRYRPEKASPKKCNRIMSDI
jgi:hypothetical protein